MNEEKIDRLLSIMSGAGLQQFIVRVDSIELTFWKVIDGVDVIFHLETSSSVSLDANKIQKMDTPLEIVCEKLCKCLNSLLWKIELTNRCTYKISFVNGFDIYIGGKASYMDEIMSIVVEDWPIKGEEVYFGLG